MSNKQHHTQLLTNAVHGANACQCISLVLLSLKCKVTEFIHEGIPGHVYIEVSKYIFLKEAEREASLL